MIKMELSQIGLLKIKVRFLVRSISVALLCVLFFSVFSWYGEGWTMWITIEFYICSLAGPFSIIRLYGLDSGHLSFYITGFILIGIAAASFRLSNIVIFKLIFSLSVFIWFLMGVSIVTMGV